MKGHMLKISIAAVVIIVIVAGFIITKNNSHETLHFFVESPIINPTKEQSVKDVQALLSTKKLEVAINLSQKRLLELDNKNEKIDAGITALGQVILANNEGRDFVPVMAISPSPNSECAAEAQIAILKNSPIKDIKMLQGKNIGISMRAIRTMYYLFPELKNAGIKFNRIHVDQSPEWIIEALKDNTIDAAILYHIQVQKAPKAKGEFGLIMNGEYEDAELNLKVLKVSETNLPCRVLFVSNSLDKAKKDHFLNQFQEALQNKANIAQFSDLAQIGSAKPITPEELEKMKQLIKDAGSIKLRSFSDDINN